MVSGRESEILRGQTPICRRFRPDAAGNALFSILGQTPSPCKCLNFKQIVSSAEFGRALVTAVRSSPNTTDLLETSGENRYPRVRCLWARHHVEAVAIACAKAMTSKTAVR